MVTIGSLAEVQRALNRLGGASLPEDGVMGPATRQAIIDFQKTYMLPPTGEADNQTRSLIAQSLGQIGIPAFVPAEMTGALPSAASTVVDRSAQIKQQALLALYELREIGLTAVADTLRHLVAEPTLDNLRQGVTVLAQPAAGAFANQTAALWRPVLDSYSKHGDPAALSAAIASQMAPLLSQIDGVLGAINHLAAYPTVDNLNSTIATLSQQSALGARLAQPLQAVLATVTAA